MRVIGGHLRGKKILDPLDKSTRPLKDIVKESIFNIVKHSKKEFVKLSGAKVLDIFAGTGSFGIECLSRGASKVFFFENYSKSIEILKKNIDQLDLNKKTRIINKDAYKINKTNLNNINFDLIFLDPPFTDKSINQLITEIKKLKITNKKTLIIIHRNKKFEEQLTKDLIILREKSYGLSKIIFGKII